VGTRSRSSVQRIPPASTVRYSTYVSWYPPPVTDAGSVIPTAYRISRSTWMNATVTWACTAKTASARLATRNICTMPEVKIVMNTAMTVMATTVSIRVTPASGGRPPRPFTSRPGRPARC